MESETVRSLSYEDLKLYTDSFSEDNYIGNFQFGKVYRGFIGSQQVTVKKWEDPKIYGYLEGDNEKRFKEEILLLQHSKVRNHPNVAKLIGYCCEGEEQLGVVFDLKPLDSVYNLVLKDSFTWAQRVKVIIGFARLLEHMHVQESPNSRYLICNIDAAHIMLDEDYNPKLFDFGMISGGIFPDRRSLPWYRVLGCYGYIDVDYRTGGFSDKVDIFAFGTLILMLITKRVFFPEDRLDLDIPTVVEWVDEVYEPKKSAMGFLPSKYSLVHNSLRKKPGFNTSDGLKLTKLAMRCTNYWHEERPSMKKVVRFLLNLRVIRRHPDLLGSHSMLPTNDASQRKTNVSVTS